MSKALITESYLTDIANAIRSKAGSSSLFSPPNMAQAIRSISGGANILSGTTDPTADLGEDGQIYLKYQIMSLSDYFTFTDATLQPDGVTLVFSSEGGSLTTKFSRKTFVAEVSNLPAEPYGPSGHGYNLLYGNSAAQYWLKSSIVNSFAGNTNGLYCNYNYGTVELTNYPNCYDRPSNKVCGGVTFKLISVDNVVLGDTITAVYLKVNGAWQALIGSDVDDVSTETSGIKTRQTSAFDLAGLIESGDFYWSTSAVGELNV